MKNILNYTENKLFMATSSTELHDFCEEVFLLSEKYPEIISAIRNDQDQHGILKKQLRLEEKQYAVSTIPDLPGIDIEESEYTVMLSDGGRPRMQPELVLLFILLRGYFGSVTDWRSRERIKDSLTLNILFSNLNMKIPAPTTILENINCISDGTMDLIFTCQLKEVLNCEADDFSKLIVDSTSVAASSCWPTDANIILKLIERVSNYGKKLEQFGLKNIQDFYMPEWKKSLKKLLFAINTAKGTKKKPKKEKIKPLYADFIETAEKAFDYLVRNFESRSARMSLLKLSPAARKILDGIHRIMEDDLLALSSVLHYTQERVFNGVVLKSPDKIISLSDVSAAFIKKGDRNPVIGYKPQLGMSKNGFVCSFILEKGNASDSNNLLPLIEAAEYNTGITPETVIADDGYSSQKAYDDVMGKGIRVLSLSGAVGKKITPDELWESLEYTTFRRQRSAVESLIFTLKYVFEFGRMKRRSLENVRREMLEKITAYNIRKLIRHRKAPPEILQAA